MNIDVVEYPDRLVFVKLGSFNPPSVEWMLEHQSPPERYRNQWLIEGMVRLRMIDQIGSGIRRMFETQRERFFPLPEYTIDSNTAAVWCNSKCRVKQGADMGVGRWQICC